MKKRTLFLALLASALIALSGCSAPNSLQLDLSQGYGNHNKLLHLNASNGSNRQRIEDFAAILENAAPLEKDAELFAYYPDYLLTISRKGQKTTALVDVNGSFVDFMLLEEEQVYRANISPQELKALVHQSAH